jgi:hypothetical protein
MAVYKNNCSGKGLNIWLDTFLLDPNSSASVVSNKKVSHLSCQILSPFPEQISLDIH